MSWFERTRKRVDDLIADMDKDFEEAFADLGAGTLDGEGDLEEIRETEVKPDGTRIVRTIKRRRVVARTS